MASHLLYSRCTPCTPVTSTADPVSPVKRSAFELELGSQDTYRRPAPQKEVDIYLSGLYLCTTEVRTGG